MSATILENIIQDFQPDKFTKFFREKNNRFAPRREKLDQYEDENFENCMKLGDIKFNDDESAIVCIFQVTRDLSERSGKRSQYEKGKKILRDGQHDAGFFIFYDTQGNFRFSLIYANYLGKRRDWSSFRRFTYFASSKFTNRTFLQRVGEGDLSSLDAVKDAFSVEKVNEEFYRHIAQFFNKLTGYKVDKQLVLPSVGEDDDRKDQEFAVRLIGRIIFCWFLKHKKSKTDKPLLSELVLSSSAVKKNPDYYHNVLEKLFFEVLNTPLQQRGNKALSGSEKIPYVNGGLFEAHCDDYYHGKPLYSLKIPDEWFDDFLQILEQYNFTIDENSIVDSDVSVDPEMLGRILENLLAAINPDTGETVRKETGSYYTRRDIVDYMVDQALNHTLTLKTKISAHKLDDLLSYDVQQVVLSESEKRLLVSALSTIKIIDPACGSGAFPLGVLHKILLILEKIDQDAKLWLNEKLAHIEDNLLRQEIINKLKTNSLTYIRKLFIIRDSIYGVDIQKIAVEISKLRVFLSLIVDEVIDENESNWNVEPLPNLEFKFVTANSLIGLPELEATRMQMFEDQESIKTLAQIRSDYFSSHGENKFEIEQKFEEVQDRMIKFYVDHANKRQKRLDGSTKKSAGEIQSVTQMLSNWRPFSHDQNEWFNAKWMLGVEEGFDIVISNPPYVKGDKIVSQKSTLLPHYRQGCVERSDLSCYFYVLGLRLLKPGGVQVFICTNSWLDVQYGVQLQSFLLHSAHVVKIIGSSYERFFTTASIKTIISIVVAKDTKENATTEFILLQGPLEQAVRNSNMRRVVTFSKQELINAGTDIKGKYTGEKWRGKCIDAPDIYWKIAEKAGGNILPLKTVGHAEFALKTGADPFFYVSIISRNRDKVEIVNGLGDRFWIEKKYVEHPILTKAQEVRKPVLTADDCNKVLILFNEQAKEQPLANKYIQYGENKGYHEDASCKSRRPWFVLNPPDFTPLIIAKRYHTRFPFAIVEDKSIFIGQVYYCVYINESGVNAEIIAASLNSTFGILCRELNGRANFGDGMLELARYEVDNLPVLNAAKIDRQALAELVNAHKSIMTRPFESIYDEVTRHDRLQLDHCFLKCLGYSASEASAATYELYKGACATTYNRLSPVPRSVESKLPFEQYWLNRK